MSTGTFRRCAMLMLCAFTAGASSPARDVERDVSIQWVKISGGKFTMGAADIGSRAQPRHEVTVKSFQMAKTLVTNKQYKTCVAAGACTAAHSSDGTCNSVFTGTNWVKGDLPDSFQGDDHPVVCVDWEQSHKFSSWAGGRLPTEAEWEYAARSGGKEQSYPWGNAAAACANSVIAGCGHRATAPVCSKSAGNTKQGLCDMAGNAWEWTQDGYRDTYNGAPSDGSAWEGPAVSSRVVRGGAWSVGASFARSKNRYGDDAAYRGGDMGFRIAR